MSIITSKYLIFIFSILLCFICSALVFANPFEKEETCYGETYTNIVYGNPSLKSAYSSGNEIASSTFDPTIDCTCGLYTEGFDPPECEAWIAAPGNCGNPIDPGLFFNDVPLDGETSLMALMVIVYAINRRQVIKRRKL